MKVADWVHSVVLLAEVTRICLSLSASQEAALRQILRGEQSHPSSHESCWVRAGQKSLSHPADSRFHTCLGEHSEKREVSLELCTGKEHTRALRCKLREDPRVTASKLGYIQSESKKKRQGKKERAKVRGERAEGKSEGYITRLN